MDPVWAWGVSAMILAGCGPTGGTFCDDKTPVSCYELDFKSSTISIVWPDGNKKLALNLIQTGDKAYYFPNPLGEDKGKVNVTIVDEDTIAVLNENSQGEPVIHKRKP